MRLCRIGPETAPQAAFYFDTQVLPLAVALLGYGKPLDIPAGDDLLELAASPNVRALFEWANLIPDFVGAVPLSAAELLVPVPKPNKIFLLAGNYAEHVIERGGTVAERTETFPYVFMKPPSTTLTHPGRPVVIPKNAPEGVDWELELAVVIGKRCKNVSEADALNYVVGYTALNDITQRKFKPNPGRKKRERDVFFDWLHGKWFDTFCPCGPCLVTANAIPDPQSLPLTLTLNGEVKQNGNTGQMIFSVAALIEFISAMVTLEPGDLISTGTPAGVGSAKGTFLKPGDVLHGTIGGIGTLITPVVAE